MRFRVWQCAFLARGWASAGEDGSCGVWRGDGLLARRLGELSLTEVNNSILADSQATWAVCVPLPCRPKETDWLPVCMMLCYTAITLAGGDDGGVCGWDCSDDAMQPPSLRTSTLHFPHEKVGMRLLCGV